MKINLCLFIFSVSILFTACNPDKDNAPDIEIPETYSFLRDGQTTVSYSGQTTRILMAEELITALKDFGSTELGLLEMYANQTADGNDANPFSDADLNNSTKSIKSKTAASADFFAANTVDAFQIKEQFEEWISLQVNEIFPNENVLAEAGIAGQIADGTSTRYINAQGLEYNQLINKGLIGALMTDQALNNYLGIGVLDAGDNQINNEAETVEAGKNYTTMEHKWDEAYGYIYGTSANSENPNLTIGSDDSFLNKYIGKINEDPDFEGIAADIFEAFKTGRAAIVAGEYELRDEQANIIRKKISEVIAARAVHYLQQGRIAIEANDFGRAFHNLSEGYGFIYSLQFTRKSDAISPYFSKTEVENILTDLLDDGQNGLWDIQTSTLDNLSNTIADRFEFSVEMARE